MVVKRRCWTKDALIDFFDIKDLYDANAKVEVLCTNDGCLFEVSIKECDLSYMNLSGNPLEKDYVPYWEIKCPYCKEKIMITKSKFKK